MGLLYGRARRLNTKNGGFRPGQTLERLRPWAPAVRRGTAEGESVIKYTSSLSVLKGPYDHSCY
jgi:hypothetical protein